MTPPDTDWCSLLGTHLRSASAFATHGCTTIAGRHGARAGGRSDRDLRRDGDRGVAATVTTQVERERQAIRARGRKNTSPAAGQPSARPRRTPHPAPASPMRPATRSAARGTLTRSSPNEGGLLAQPSRRQCLLRCGVSVLSLEPLRAVGRLAPLDRVLRQRSG